jgi:hypothetical protein
VRDPIFKRMFETGGFYFHEEPRNSTQLTAPSPKSSFASISVKQWNKCNPRMVALYRCTEAIVRGTSTFLGKRHQQDSRAGCLARSERRVAKNDARRSRGSKGGPPGEASCRVAGHHHSRTSSLTDSIADWACRCWAGEEKRGGEDRDAVSHVHRVGFWSSSVKMCMESCW